MSRMDIESTLIISRPDAAPDRAAIPPARQVPIEQEPPPKVNHRNDLVRYSATDDVLDEASKFQRQSGYDQPAGKGKQAVESYLSLERESRRDDIHKMLGVDIYA
ncbi:hypothetical protein OPS25_01565 [Alteromonas ponticola]|uniref:Chromosome segregation ATPase n=1 Tax=Alteromonas aquimaris TaxID=2998417 RepID=A0ABT3P506_9ALTE|nr:hypothetical protein [Alteromonas aquimaris]MCW8107191.1 hypothetical protein [Alteromonas aquimaris]